MQPTLPTPQEAAQWVMETHVALMAGEVTHTEHQELLEHLAAVYDEMETRDLGRALGAMTDIAEELAVELTARGIDPAHILNLLRTGVGRLHVTRPLPTKHSSIGVVPARRLARLVARTSLWAHLADGCDDDATLDAFTDDLDLEQAALEHRPRAQLVLVSATLREFTGYLQQAGAPQVATVDLGGGSTPEQSRRNVDHWASVIRGQSEALYASTGSMDLAWAVHREFFD